MFRLIIALVSLLNVVAFAPVGRVQSRAISMGFESELGAQPPLGFWDPLGFLKDADQTKFNQLRFAELKHGRIAQLAVVGHLAQYYFRFPGTIGFDGTKFSDYPNGWDALVSLPPLGLAQIFLSIGWWELKGWKQVPGSTPGDFGIPYVSSIKTEADKIKARAQELNNGRAAMMGIFAILVHELPGKHPYVINDLLGIDYKF